MTYTTDPVAGWETITPEMARSYLASSPGNRTLRKGAIQRWAADAKAGRFMMNGETIKFDRHGKLRDGHHRMHAIIEAGVAVRVLVVRGIHEDAMPTVDGGNVRRNGDRLQMAGETNTSALSAALNWQRRYEDCGETFPSRGSAALQGDDVFVALEAHPSMRDAATLQNRMRFLRRLLSPGMLVFCLYHTPNSLEFWRQLEEGNGLLAGSPVLLLRNRLLEEKAKKTRLLDYEVLALVIKAHNAWRRGQSLVTLRWRAGGDKPEAFPRWLSR